MMKLILKEDVPHLGVVGDLVTVRDGYGRNYLIPLKKAVLASTRSMSELEHQKRVAAHHRAKATAQANVDKKQIEGLSIVMSAKVAASPVVEGEVNTEVLQKLFGSITTRDLANAFANIGTKVDHKRISFSEHVRTVGKYFAQVRLDGGVSARVPFWVIPEGAADVEAEKKRVEAAQEKTRKQAEEHAAAERAKAAALAAQEREKAKADQQAKKTKGDEGGEGEETAEEEE